MKKGSRSWHRSDRQQTAAESDSQGCNVTIDHVLMALILLVFIVFFDDFKSMVFLDRHPLPEHGYKLQKKPEGLSTYVSSCCPKIEGFSLIILHCEYTYLGAWRQPREAAYGPFHTYCMEESTNDFYIHILLFLFYFFLFNQCTTMWGSRMV